MTAPVQVGRNAGDMRMAFYLPADYDYDTAPRPTSPDVHLVAVPERTLAVKRFSWWPTTSRRRRQTDAMLATLEREGIDPIAEPFWMGYDAPGTPPFMRTNEVAVEVDWTG